MTDIEFEELFKKFDKLYPLERIFPKTGRSAPKQRLRLEELMETKLIRQALQKLAKTK